MSSIHSHFLLARSDWLSHFLDSAGEELETQLVESIDMNRINTLLDFAIRSNVSSKFSAYSYDLGDFDVTLSAAASL